MGSHCTMGVINLGAAAIQVLRLRSTAREASGIVNLSLCVSKTVTDIYLKQVTVEQHMNEIYYLKDKKAYV